MACSSTSKSEEMEPENEQCTLFEACKRGDLELIKQTLTSEKVNARDLAGRKSTPLHFAAGIIKCLVGYNIMSCWL